MNYIIKKEETLLTIAKEYNISLSKLLEENNLKNPGDSFPGQLITLPEPEVFIIHYSTLNKDNLEIKIEKFLNYIEGKKLKRPLSSLAKDSIEMIFNKCLQLELIDLRMVSYILATAYWETGSHGQRQIYEPSVEYNKGRDKPYGFPHKKTGQVYYGRGFIKKLVWFDEYERFTKLLNKLEFKVDLISTPDLALSPEIASVILVAGMQYGKFTGAELSDYFDDYKSDWYNAKKIISKVDNGVIVSEIAKEIYYIIK